MKTINENKKGQRIILILLCAFVAISIAVMLIMSGNAETVPLCGKEEHKHSQECYIVYEGDEGIGYATATSLKTGEVVYISEEPLCGLEEHVHDESCYLPEDPSEDASEEDESLTEEEELSEETEEWLSENGEDDGFECPYCDIHTIHGHADGDQIAAPAGFAGIMGLAAGDFWDLRNFVTLAEIRTTGGVIIPPGGTLTTGQNYNATFKFKEAGLAKQMEYKFTGYLEFQLPSNITVPEAATNKPIYGTGTPAPVIGRYSIDTTGLVTLKFDNVMSNGQPTPDGKNFIDYYGNAEITLVISVRFEVTGGDIYFIFGNGVNIHFDVVTPPPALVVTKQAEAINMESQLAKYTVIITAKNGSVSNISLADTIMKTVPAPSEPISDAGVLMYLKYKVRNGAWIDVSSPELPLNLNFTGVTLNADESIIVEYVVDLETLISLHSEWGLDPINHSVAFENTAVANGISDSIPLTASASAGFTSRRNVTPTKFGAYDPYYSNYGEVGGILKWNASIGDGVFNLSGSPLTDIVGFGHQMVVDVLHPFTATLWTINAGKKTKVDDVIIDDPLELSDITYSLSTITYPNGFQYQIPSESEYSCKIYWVDFVYYTQVTDGLVSPEKYSNEVIFWPWSYGYYSSIYGVGMPTTAKHSIAKKSEFTVDALGNDCVEFTADIFISSFYYNTQLMVWDSLFADPVSSPTDPPTYQNPNIGSSGTFYGLTNNPIEMSFSAKYTDTGEEWEDSTGKTINDYIVLLDSRNANIETTTSIESSSRPWVHNDFGIFFVDETTLPAYTSGDIKLYYWNNSYWPIDRDITLTVTYKTPYTAELLALASGYSDRNVKTTVNGANNMGEVLAQINLREKCGLIMNRVSICNGGQAGHYMWPIHPSTATAYTRIAKPIHKGLYLGIGPSASPLLQDNEFFYTILLNYDEEHHLFEPGSPAIITDIFDASIIEYVDAGENIEGRSFYAYTGDKGSWNMNRRAAYAPLEYESSPWPGHYIDYTSNLITYSPDGKTGTLTIDLSAPYIMQYYPVGSVTQSAVRKVSDPNWYATYEPTGSIIGIQLKFRFKDDAIAATIGELSAHNTVQITDKYGNGWSDDCWVSYEVPIVEKEMNQESDTNVANVEITVNKGGKLLVSGGDGRIEVVDKMNNTLAFYLTTIVVEERVSSAWQPLLDCSWELTGENEVTFDLPDETEIRITYKALIIGSGPVDVANYVDVTGIGHAAVEETYIVLDTTASGVGSREDFLVKKFDDTNKDTPLQGAWFALYVDEPYDPLSPSWKLSDNIAPSGVPQDFDAQGSSHTFYYIGNTFLETDINGEIPYGTWQLIPSFGYVYALLEITPPDGYFMPSEVDSSVQDYVLFSFTPVSDIGDVPVHLVSDYMGLSNVPGFADAEILLQKNVLGISSTEEQFTFKIEQVANAAGDPYMGAKKYTAFFTNEGDYDSSGEEVFSHVIEGLKIGTYWFKITEVNVGGDGHWELDLTSEYIIEVEVQADTKYGGVTPDANVTVVSPSGYSDTHDYLEFTNTYNENKYHVSLNLHKYDTVDDNVVKPLSGILFALYIDTPVSPPITPPLFSGIQSSVYKDGKYYYFIDYATTDSSGDLTFTSKYISSDYAGAYGIMEVTIPKGYETTREFFDDPPEDDELAIYSFDPSSPNASHTIYNNQIMFGNIPKITNLKIDIKKEVQAPDSKSFGSTSKSFKFLVESCLSDGTVISSGPFKYSTIKTFDATGLNPYAANQYTWTINIPVYCNHKYYFKVSEVDESYGGYDWVYDPTYYVVQVIAEDAEMDHSPINGVDRYSNYMYDFGPGFHYVDDIPGGVSLYFLNKHFKSNGTLELTKIDALHSTTNNTLDGAVFGLYREYSGDPSYPPLIPGSDYEHFDEYITIEGNKYYFIDYGVTVGGKITFNSFYIDDEYPGAYVLSEVVYPKGYANHSGNIYYREDIMFSFIEGKGGNYEDWAHFGCLWAEDGKISIENVPKSNSLALHIRKDIESMNSPWKIIEPEDWWMVDETEFQFSLNQCTETGELLPSGLTKLYPLAETYISMSMWNGYPTTATFSINLDYNQTYYFRLAEINESNDTWKYDNSWYLVEVEAIILDHLYDEYYGDYVEFYVSNVTHFTEEHPEGVKLLSYGYYDPIVFTNEYYSEGIPLLPQTGGAQTWRPLLAGLALVAAASIGLTMWKKRKRNA